VLNARQGPGELAQQIEPVRLRSADVPVSASFPPEVALIGIGLDSSVPDLRSAILRLRRRPAPATRRPVRLFPGADPDHGNRECQPTNDPESFHVRKSIAEREGPMIVHGSTKSFERKQSWTTPVGAATRGSNRATVPGPLAGRRGELLASFARVPQRPCGSRGGADLNRPRASARAASRSPGSSRIPRRR
jgi:hypothetical protein